MSFNDLQNLLNKDLEQTINSYQNKPKIMFVDDDKDLLEDLALYFNNQFIAVLCDNGKEAIEKINAEIHCVVLDIKMPENDGFFTYQEIKKKILHTPIIFYSAYQNLKNPFVIMNQYRPFGYVIKGSDTNQLTDSVYRAVNYYSRITNNNKLASDLEKEILEQDAIEIEQNALITELKIKQSELSELNRILVHDLKSPLFAIKMFLSYLEHNLDEGHLERFRDDTALIQTAADIMKKILDDLVVLLQKKYPV